ncbi:MAG: DNA mismatch repair protein MutS [Pyrinomonadaceae bacterium]|nr:DNA mismatch repair protein MutS [Pyrinomonadaceae bacterium]
MTNTTPMLRQYLEIKSRFPGTILFFRLGDFYEMFNEDAVVASRVLEITLTARQKDTPNPIPMCGVPHHSASGYIAKLIKNGFRVAICEQTEEAGKGVKLVNRDVVRVITPGTAIDPQLLDSRESTYLAAVAGKDEHFAAAFLEVSAGRLLVTESTGANAFSRICEQLESFSPREILASATISRRIGQALGISTESIGLFEKPKASGGTVITELDSEQFDPAQAEQLLSQHFGVRELASFGLSGKVTATAAAAACLTYAKETQRASADHISSIEFLDSADHMVLDNLTLRNLEILESRSESSKKTLCDVIDETVTGMGSRLLKQWLLRPLLRRNEIQTRLSAVEELQDSIMREKLRFLLKEVADLERLIGRVNLGTVSPRDLIALKRSLGQTPQINAILNKATSLLLQVLAENIFELPEIRSVIENGISDEPPMLVSDGGVIKAGFNSDLDELRSISSNVKQIIASFEASERQRSGIASLKVRFNNVFGYYIEVPKAQLARVPEYYERRQTLANAERYTTPELKEWELKVLGADEQIAKLEQTLFASIRDLIKSESRRLQVTARSIATLDALCSLAETAARRNYVMPTLHDGDELEIRGGRHPIVEAFVKDSFVPNDAYLNNSTDRLLIITGANMGGKSTILRQIAIVQILAQIGSFVPATAARLPIVDRVWTRVGASDDVASGRSTFMVEMTETATILRNSTPRSLILLDEIGRGTSTFDGLSIAWAVAEYLHNSSEHAAKTLFATHYHELTELADLLPGAKNYQITATEEDGQIVFFHKLLAGRASKSYGIAVARLAGLPAEVIVRAKGVLAKLEEYELAVVSDVAKVGVEKAAASSVASQATLFSLANETALDAIRSVDVEALSDAEARELLASVRSKIV